VQTDFLLVSFIEISEKIRVLQQVWCLLVGKFVERENFSDGSFSATKKQQEGSMFTRLGHQQKFEQCSKHSNIA
jgi:hypothetical protein